MKTLMVYPANEKQEKALIAVFDALQVDYTEGQKQKKKSAKEKLLHGLREAVQEVNLIKAGKLKGIDAKDLLNEL